MRKALFRALRSRSATPATASSSDRRFPPTCSGNGFREPGPAAKPNAPVESSIRNVAYALLSGADGWMFDGEDALGQIHTMSLDNQRNLKLAIHRDPVFMEAAAKVAEEMNAWALEFHGRKIVHDWQAQLDFTTKIFRARGLHLDDRHIRTQRWPVLFRFDRRPDAVRRQQL